MPGCFSSADIESTRAGFFWSVVINLMPFVFSGVRFYDFITVDVVAGVA